MGRVRVVRNDLPKIIRRLPDAVDKEAMDSAKAMSVDLSSKVWFEWGWIEQATFARSSVKGKIAEVVCGINRGHGFYSRFQEWGTVYQGARPVVGPTAHQWEPIYGRRMAAAVKRACTP